MAVLVKTLNGLAYASVKTRTGLAAASIKAINGLDVTSGGSAPAFDSEVARTTPTFASGASQIFALLAGVSTGKRIVIVVGYDTGVTITSVTDSQGNAYSVDANVNASSGGASVGIASAPVTTALTILDTITVNFSGSFAGWRGAVGVTLTNTTALDVTATQSTPTTTPSAGATTSAPTAIIGAIVSPNTSFTVTVPDGTMDGAVYNYNDGAIAVLYKNAGSAGAQTIGGTISPLSHTGTIFAAYK